jgi:hypothetical protein
LKYKIPARNGKSRWKGTTAKNGMKEIKNPGKIKENIDPTGLPIAECGRSLHTYTARLHSTAQGPAAATCLCTAEWRQLSQ